MSGESLSTSSHRHHSTPKITTILGGRPEKLPGGETVRRSPLAYSDSHDDSVDDILESFFPG
jgi:hypothetical protein